MYIDYSDYKNEIEIMKHLLRIQHYVPVAPDLIASIPFQRKDPFIMDHTPG